MALFTKALSTDWSDFWSGRGDSNSRSPAPKAGALATTLRPVGVSEESKGSSSQLLTKTANLTPERTTPQVGALLEWHPPPGQNAGVAQW